MMDNPEVSRRQFVQRTVSVTGGGPIDEARRAMKLIARAYQDLIASENFSHFIETGAGHVLSIPMWEKVPAFFARHLGLAGCFCDSIYPMQCN